MRFQTIVAMILLYCFVFLVSNCWSDIACADKEVASKTTTASNPQKTYTGTLNILESDITELFQTGKSFNTVVQVTQAQTITEKIYIRKVEDDNGKCVGGEDIPQDLSFEQYDELLSSNKYSDLYKETESENDSKFAIAFSANGILSTNLFPTDFFLGPSKLDKFTESLHYNQVEYIFRIQNYSELQWYDFDIIEMNLLLDSARARLSNLTLVTQ
ncbi:MAG: hypothetical protein D6767_04610 [Candidatus Hydrogenedentota bacterium]|nr:MAG: hypothetical protein D6767_04610 [Candidatus Hydrogenedentota bacterium]